MELSATEVFKEAMQQAAGRGGPEQAAQDQREQHDGPVQRQPEDVGDDTGSGDAHEPAIEEPPIVEGVDGEGDAEQEQEGEGQEGEGAEGESPDSNPQAYTPAELAEAIGWEARDLYDSLQIPLSGNGDVVSLGELKDRYQAAVTRESQIAEQEQALRQQYQQFEAERNEFLTGGATASKAVLEAQAKWEQLEKAYQGITQEQWDALSPGERADLRTQFSEAKEKVAREFHAAQQKHQQALNEHQQKVVHSHLQALIKEPEFSDIRDQQGLQSRLGELGEFAVQHLGISREELPHIIHHKAIKTLYWAKKGIEAEKAKGTFKEKVRGVPKKVLKPGAGKVPGQDQSRLNDLEHQAKRGGHKAKQKLAVEVFRQAMANRKV